MIESGRSTASGSSGSLALWNKACNKACSLMPGGVSSPVRSFAHVGDYPRFIARGHGPFIWDVDGARYVDYVLSWGALALGHAHPRAVEAVCQTAQKGTSYGACCKLEIQLAELLVETFPSVDMVRFANSGTEATMSALRLARAFTGKDKIVKFAGGYHGHVDSLLVKAGSGPASLACPDSPGVPASTVADTIVVPDNDLSALENVLGQHPDEIAAVITEPIMGNMGFIRPRSGFLSFFAPSQFEVAFLSSAHDCEAVENTRAAIDEVFAAIAAGGSRG